MENVLTLVQEEDDKSRIIFSVGRKVGTYFISCNTHNNRVDSLLSD